METTVIILISDVIDANTETMKHRYFLIDFFLWQAVTAKSLSNCKPRSNRPSASSSCEAYDKDVWSSSRKVLLELRFISVFCCFTIKCLLNRMPLSYAFKLHVNFHGISLKWNFFFSTFCVFIRGRNGCRGMFQIAAHKSMQELTLSIGNGKRVIFIRTIISEFWIPPKPSKTTSTTLKKVPKELKVHLCSLIIKLIYRSWMKMKSGSRKQWNEKHTYLATTQ